MRMSGYEIVMICMAAMTLLLKVIEVIYTLIKKQAKKKAAAYWHTRWLFEFYHRQVIIFAGHYSLSLL